jgi:hypothetical protein
MHVTTRRWIVVACGLALSLPAHSGPYFNPPSRLVGELAQASVRQLSEARITVIRMLTELDFGRVDRANELRKVALGQLNEAIGQFKQIQQKVSDKPIDVFKANNEREKQITIGFVEGLKRRQREVPKTERDLAALAVDITTEYAKTIAEAKLEGFPKQWEGVRQIILAEINLLSIGNLTSVVWTINEQ